MPPPYVRKCQHHHRVFDVVIKRSRRKTLAIHVLRSLQVEIRAPLQCAWRDIDAFLNIRLDWVVNALDTLARLPPVRLAQYTEGEMHDYLGVGQELLLVRGNPQQVILGPGQLLVRCPAPADPRQVERCLARFWRQRALQVFEMRLLEGYRRFAEIPLPGKTLGKLTVRKMTARWGSCSRSGDICLNSVLVQKPLAAIDMVIAHELCHLYHFSHSAGFYQLLGTVMPDWQDHEALLNMPTWRPQD
ncbi:MAG: M48 family metallopeptidase [Pseudomonadales bacterium]|jgi:predicted metal-dependent hydrolase|nr:M48 family metallopeptidase [Pseudomonadales bacterium]MDP4640639.1 M48 family metallopeptidase [Pseudomonadales bacterium]MDP4765751.1 M48 family metallopeptidase [Pseudomonadales bacterium]MDP4874442.1 M48 family metallopeptidase [Pseudomonadales bacterium]MDP4910359.1 M48 family metallopeptidase [Pseudomonadales bacterium]